MDKPYIAHKSEDGAREQTVLAHLEGTAALAERFASAFGEPEQGRLAGMAHDIGKFSRAFQRRIHGESISVDHATAGAFECARLGQNFAAIAVAGHHGGLPNLGSRLDSQEEATFFGRMSRAKEKRLEDYAAWKTELELPRAPQPKPEMRSALDGSFFVRMLYSCLVDADFLDTEAFMLGRTRQEAVATIDQLIGKLDAHCRRWARPEAGSLNERRGVIQSRCRLAGEAEEPGLFTLTIPTGGGKTLSSMAFALHHARRHGMKRVIYVIPYTSIIEQNAKVFADVFGGENVLEHHSDVLYDVNEGDATSVRKAQATENWDMPIVVTTAVQFFESLFAARSGKCRKLHNIVGSVVIFDEAQMLPLPYLRPCVYAISQLVKHYRVSAVLCTATQPALNDVFEAFLPGVMARELCPDTDFAPFRRVTFAQAGELSNATLAQRLNDQRQALCIVNTRKRAGDVYRLLQKDGSFHLSTLMTPAHRKAVIAEIRTRLTNNQPCRVVSTSLIEAGVDVDFPAVFREEAGLDSIMQAAGRCNREGKRPREASIVTVFSGESAPPALFQPAIGAGRQALKKHGAPDAPGAIECYFKELLEVNGTAAQDKNGILDLLNETRLRDAAERFRLIEDNTRTIYIPMKENEPLLERLRAGERSRGLFRRLGQFGVSVYEEHLKALWSSVEQLDENCFVLISPELYSEKTGLSMQGGGGNAEFV